MATKPSKKPAASGASILVRLPAPSVERIDRWIGEQPDKPSRPEAIRRLISEAFKK